MGVRSRPGAHGGVLILGDYRAVPGVILSNAKVEDGADPSSSGSPAAGRARDLAARVRRKTRTACPADSAARSPSSQVEHHLQTTPDGGERARSAVRRAGRSRWHLLQTRRRNEMNVANDCWATGQCHRPSLWEFLAFAGQPETDEESLGSVPAVVGDHGEYLLQPSDWQSVEVDAAEAWVSTRGRLRGLRRHCPVNEVSDVEHRDKGGNDRR